MRAGSIGALVLVYVFATACGGATTPAAPSGLQLPTPASVTISVSGTVRDAFTNATLAGTDVRVTSGPDATRATTTDASGNYTLTGLKVGIFNLRFGRAGYEIVERPVNTSDDTRLDIRLRPGLACVAPQAPGAFRAAVSASRVTFTWAEAVGATSYLVVVGTSQGSSNALSVNTTQTTYQWRGVAPGTYFARVFARNDCTHDTSSSEITFTITP